MLDAKLKENKITKNEDSAYIYWFENTILY